MNEFADVVRRGSTDARCVSYLTRRSGSYLSPDVDLAHEAVQHACVPLEIRSGSRSFAIGPAST